MKFTNRAGFAVVSAVIEAVCANRDYLSRVDAAVGDGDHGINMSKGFSIAGEELSKQPDTDMSTGFLTISTVLVGKIGGSMGPLYGGFFRGLAMASKNEPIIDAAVMGNMLRKAYDRIALLTDAAVGDKTLIDVLDPAVRAYEEAEAGGDLEACLGRMLEAARNGLEATKGMAAKLGRGSRLGDRAIGHQDAGATSCYIILEALAEASLRLAKTG
ncbi:dihydroxyacetone kinase subunit DhaL [Paenibacillus macerans]|uniref:phosphoenolpyruvate--glycerone phosphotransferase n=1 Tax=Paenibacillus macerans TaxID=44252 RepID=A0A090Z606_PAEMA|nr:dihydroxyacetone kinase subunit DhaL [Paenibacillus macerans]KFN05595.1 dihydroxyacetone kinase, L subunit [Paenibacillus macerans]MCY7557997.1 dihydroxyacetone kinase subunit L [Paenibacillus macerans]MEC0154448.1 dihydroxyacetone kinase subunit DhaL [Paenibacillus macerans]SUA85292.1 dihydroxyacetone kinase [Paenibacillus macerans]